MSVEQKNGTMMMAAVTEAVDQYSAKREELIPILNEINRRLGFLPSDALAEVGKRLKTPRSQVYSVASFYQMLSTKKRGRHVIQFCENAPCHVVGGREVFLALQEKLNLKPGETSADGKWTLITTSCLGLCAVGPVITIDEDVFGNLKPDQISDILDRYL
ncbi:MAG: NADH-quinone oxidoreductase subunit NuoE [Anaerolineaceae bacterium]